MIYFLLLSFMLLVLSFTKACRRNYTSMLPLIIMILLCGLRRYDVGIDTTSYIQSYVYRNVGDYSEGEPLFNLLMDIGHMMGFGRTGFLMLTALCTYIPLYIALRKFSPNINYSLLIYVTFSVYFYCNSFNVIRNSIAASWLLLGFYYLVNNKYKETILYTLIATGFHFSVIAVVPFLFLAKKIENLDKKYTITLLLLSVVVGLSSDYGEIATLLNAQLYMSDNSVVEHYNTVYLNDLTGHEFNTNGIIMQIAPMTLCSILSFYSKSCNKYLRTIVFLGAVLGNVFVSILYVYRITLFFNLGAIVLLPQIVNGKDTERLIKISTHLLILLLFIYFIISTIKQSDAFVAYPYHFA